MNRLIHIFRSRVHINEKELHNSNTYFASSIHANYVWIHTQADLYMTLLQNIPVYLRLKHLRCILQMTSIH